MEYTYAVQMRADLSYSGLLTKNPLHPHWRTLYWGVEALYSLAELSDHVDPTGPKFPPAGLDLCPNWP